MRRTGPLGPTIRRLRGATSLPRLAEASGVPLERLEDLEAGRALGTTAVLAQVATALGLEAPARLELQRAREATVALARANPWMAANGARGGSNRRLSTVRGRGASTGAGGPAEDRDPGPGRDARRRDHPAAQRRGRGTSPRGVA